MHVADGLNTDQSLAILAPPTYSVNVQAGAGTGKTRVFAHRVAHLLDQGVSATDMLVCTFTRNAAEEIKSRLPGHRARLRNLGTIHSLALRNRPSNNFRGTPIVTDEEAVAILSHLVQVYPEGEEDPDELYVALCLMRENRAIRPGYAPVLNAYRAALEEQGKLDFLSLLEQGLIAAPTRKFRHILVDEAQDVTRLQADWLRSVSGPGTRFFCVGDDNQAIYGFRGATALLTGSDALLFRLTANYRCTPEIIEYAKGILTNGSQLTAAAAHGDPVATRHFADRDAELQAVTAAWLANPVSFMVLGRTNAIVAPYLAAGIPACTVHAAKGREWREVWLVGMEQGNFPDWRSDDEEERRLAYVAVTRAKRRLTVSWVSHRPEGVQRKLHALSALLPRTGSGVQ